jgi:hypothetical protein
LSSMTLAQNFLIKVLECTFFVLGSRIVGVYPLIASERTANEALVAPEVNVLAMYGALRNQPLP